MEKKPPAGGFFVYRRFPARGRCGSTRLMLFGAQPWHASMFRGTGSLGSLSILRIAGVHGAEHHAGFWVLLGGPKVPPRRVLRKSIRRRISTRIAIMVRRAITSVLWTFSQPHLSSQTLHLRAKSLAALGCAPKWRCGAHAEVSFAPSVRAIRGRNQFPRVPPPAYRRG